MAGGSLFGIDKQNSDSAIGGSIDKQDNDSFADAIFGDTYIDKGAPWWAVVLLVFLLLVTLIVLVVKGR